MCAQRNVRQHHWATPPPLPTHPCDPGKKTFSARDFLCLGLKHGAVSERP